jgi:hypothetical protein
MSPRRTGRGDSRPYSFLYIPLLLVVLSLSSGLFTQACREQSAFEIDRNLPPETVLTGAPGDSTTTFYFTHLHWYGVDPDGEVLAYEFAVTDSIPEDLETIEWSRTEKTDSLFAIPVGETQEVMGRRFYIRAIDNENREDPTPAWTFFTVRDNEAPEILFTRARGVGPGGETTEITSTDLVVPSDTIPAGWTVDFAWKGSDQDVALTEDGELVRVGTVVGFSYHLTPIESNYIGGSLADTAVAYDNLFSGSYTMFVRGQDDAGFSALNPTVRSFVWNKDPQTYFEMGFDSTCACSLEHFFDGSGMEHFEGDTLPLLGGAGHTVTTRVRGWDPDDPTGEGRVTDFETRLRRNGGGFPWDPVRDPLGNVVFSGLRTGNFDILARCADLLGRKDGSPAILTFYVNKAPRFIVFGPFGLVQRPREGDVYTLDELIDSDGDWGIPVLIMSQDPDPLGGDRKPLLSYRFRAPADFVTFDFLEVGEMGNFQTVFVYSTPLPPRLAPAFVPGEYILEVRVLENRDNPSNRRTGSKKIRFTVVEG